MIILPTLPGNLSGWEPNLPGTPDLVTASTLKSHSAFQLYSSTRKVSLMLLASLMICLGCSASPQ